MSRAASHLRAVQSPSEAVSAPATGPRYAATWLPALPLALALDDVPPPADTTRRLLGGFASLLGVSASVLSIIALVLAVFG